MRVVVISDSHEVLKDRVKSNLKDCDVIIHAGDVCSQRVWDEIQRVNPSASFFLVRGNNDFWARHINLVQRFQLEGFNFLLVHNKRDLPADRKGVDFIIFGHTHKYCLEEKDGQIWLNPGSCRAGRFCDASMVILTLENGNYDIQRVLV